MKRIMSNKLEARSDKCLFVGYPKESRGYYFYNPLEQKVIVSRHAIFLEKEFILERSSRSKVELEEIQVPQTDQQLEPELMSHVDEAQTEAQDTQDFRRSSRIRHAPERYVFLISESNDVVVMDDDDPTSYEEAMSNVDSLKWHEAMKSEMDSMYENKVWTLVEPPEGIKPIGCKWVFKRKTDMDGNIVTYKARLVAKRLRTKARN